MNAEKYASILAARSQLFAGLAMAITASVKGGEAATEAKGGVVAKLREVANVTHEAGEPVQEVRAAMLATLAGFELPAGSVKASGNQLAGFRAMLADGLNIDNGGKDGKPVSAGEASAYIASDDTKRLKAIRTAISKAVQTAAGKQDGDKAGDAEARLLTIAEAIGADLEAYTATVDGQSEGQREAG